MTKSPCNGSRYGLTICAVALLGLPLGAEAQQVVISGVVIDSAARSPVAAALVTLGSGARVLTDENGRSDS